MRIFVTGATGYVGSHLIPELLRRGHTVRALVRPSSAPRLVPGSQPILGDALNAATFAHHLADSDTFIQLVGVPHPSPSKAEEFRNVDLLSVQQSVRAVANGHIRHIVYLSVAQPAPAMKAYVTVRAEGERLIRELGIPATFVRPWYVLGPGHWWPYAILPLYWIWGAFPSQRDTAQRLYPVKLAQVVRAMAEAVENPPRDVRVVEANELRGRAQSMQSALGGAAG